jgi:hypothetical protein
LSAVESALGLFAAPDRLEWFRSAPLPSGMLSVIRIAAGDQQLAATVAQATGVPVERLVEACAFFVSGVLFDAGSDHFRLLGGDRRTDEATLKQHFRWLLKWLHPDRDPEDWMSVHADRLNVAWNTLRRADRRADYVASLAAAGPVDRVQARPAPAGWPVRVPLDQMAETRPPRARVRIPNRWLQRLPVAAAVVLCLAAGGLLVADRVGRGLLESGPTPIAVETAPLDRLAADETTGMAQAPSEVPAEGAESVDVVTAPVVRPEVPSQPLRGVDVPTVARSEPSPPSPSPDKPASRDSAVQVPVTASAATPAIGRVASAPHASASAGVVASAQPAGPAFSGTQADVEDRLVVSSEVGRGAHRELALAVPPGAVADDRNGAEHISASSAVHADAGLDAVGIDSGAAVKLLQLPESVDASAGQAASVTIEQPPTIAGSLEQQIRMGRRLAADFSEAYRTGDVQRVVVLFAPNARTPEGNLVDLHGAYASLFAGSARRSLEFIQLEWRMTTDGIEGRGSFEWALQPRNSLRVRSASGPVRILIRIVDGRPLIAELEHADVG